MSALMFLGLVGRKNGTSYLFVFCSDVWNSARWRSRSLISHLIRPLPPLFSRPFLADVSEALPMMMIIGGAVGGGCVLLICVITLVSLCCRHTGKGELNGQYGQDGSTASSFPFTLHFVVCPITAKKKKNAISCSPHVPFQSWVFFFP